MFLPVQRILIWRRSRLSLKFQKTGSFSSCFMDHSVIYFKFVQSKKNRNGLKRHGVTHKVRVIPSTMTVLLFIGYQFPMCYLIWQNHELCRVPSEKEIFHL